MKKLIIIICAALLLPYAVMGQSKEIKAIFDKYEKNDKVELVSISPGMMMLANTFADDEEAKEWTSKITELRILTVPSSLMEKNIPLRTSLKADMDGIITKFAFERLLKIRDKGEEVEMYVSKNSNGALIFLNDSDAEYTVIAMFGKIDDMLIKAAASGKINIK
ncbi:MAG: DUF4252 domain-containing protein [Bacteroidales bacterium]|jgi:hypothetical protein|nr:DUF4252 domain-containing protein [Bacteroidales bacterium]